MIVGTILKLRALHQDISSRPHLFRLTSRLRSPLVLSQRTRARRTGLKRDVTMTCKLASWVATVLRATHVVRPLKINC
jgi:hypothetical protein